MINTKVDLPTGFKFVENADEADYERVSVLLNVFGLNDGDAEIQRRTFRASNGVEFIYDHDNLIACGRILSDDISQSAIYNIAVDENYHDRHIGSALMQRIKERYGHTNMVLYTHPSTVSWYENLGFSNLNTGMIIFNQEDISWFKQEKFIK